MADMKVMGKILGTCEDEEPFDYGIQFNNAKFAPEVAKVIGVETTGALAIEFIVGGYQVYNDDGTQMTHNGKLLTLLEVAKDG